MEKWSQSLQLILYPDNYSNEVELFMNSPIHQTSVSLDSHSVQEKFILEQKSIHLDLYPPRFEIWNTLSNNARYLMPMKLQDVMFSVLSVCSQRVVPCDNYPWYIGPHIQGPPRHFKRVQLGPHGTGNRLQPKLCTPSPNRSLAASHRHDQTYTLWSMYGWCFFSNAMITDQKIWNTKCWFPIFLIKLDLKLKLSFELPVRSLKSTTHSIG